MKEIGYTLIILLAFAIAANTIASLTAVRSTKFSQNENDYGWLNMNDSLFIFSTVLVCVLVVDGITFLLTLSFGDPAANVMLWLTLATCVLALGIFVVPMLLLRVTHADKLISYYSR